EHLRLVLEPTERLAVHDAIAIALERRAHIVLGFGAQASARLRALCRLRREDLELALLERLTQAGQGSPPENSCRAPAVPRQNWPPASGRDPQRWRECRDRIRA